MQSFYDKPNSSGKITVAGNNRHEYTGILYAIGILFCEEHGINYGKFEDKDIVRYNDILNAIQSNLRRDSSKYYFVHEIPAVIWAIEQGIING